MSKLEILELVLMYATFWTLVGWMFFGLIFILIRFLVFEIFNNDTPKFQDLDRKFIGGYQPKRSQDTNQNPPRGEAGGA
ncbi:hypothetical protein [Leptospira santarosai]|uniref:hypothetical protein n=1 Tax=Leptospira santarosai TaxID=28183 RepID=UPI0004783F78|nr:hypothetical protein [Leptospira santarosai]